MKRDWLLIFAIVCGAIGALGLCLSVFFCLMSVFAY